MTPLKPDDITIATFLDRHDRDIQGIHESLQETSRIVADLAKQIVQLTTTVAVSVASRDDSNRRLDRLETLQISDSQRKTQNDWQRRQNFLPWSVAAVSLLFQIIYYFTLIHK